MEASTVPEGVTVLPSGLIDRRGAATFLGRQPKTLAQWKARGVGPQPRRVGGRSYYVWEEVKAFAQGEAQGLGE